MTYTPGPWTIKRRTRPSGREQSMDYAILDPAGEIIAETFEIVGPNDYRPVEANARLIASCPTMAEYIIMKAKEGDNDAKKIAHSFGWEAP